MEQSPNTSLHRIYTVIFIRLTSGSTHHRLDGTVEHHFVIASILVLIALIVPPINCSRAFRGSVARGLCESANGHRPGRIDRRIGGTGRSNAETQDEPPGAR